MSAARTERLLNLLTLLLNSPRPLSLREIRELDEFSAYQTYHPKNGERCFERDKATLISMGVPVRFLPADDHTDDAGGYIIDQQHYYLPDLQLTSSELVLLSMAGAAAAALDGFVGKNAILCTLTKLGFDIQDTSCLPNMACLSALQEGVSSDVASCLNLLQEAIGKQQCISMIYESAQTTTRIIAPYGLYFVRGHWYVVAWCYLRAALRTFSVRRMQHIHSSKIAFKPAPVDFCLKDYADRRAWELSTETIVDVRMRLAPGMRDGIPDIFGKHYHIESQDADAVYICLQVTDTQALIRSLLPYGAAIEILTPPDVRHKMRDIYQALVHMYQQQEVPLHE